MDKKIKFKKIETNIPCDEYIPGAPKLFISNIDGLIGKVNKVYLDVYFTSKKIYELDDVMYVMLDMHDDTGEMKALLVGNRDKHFISLVDSIRINNSRYRIGGNVSIPDKTDEEEFPLMNEIKDNKLFCIYALTRNPKAVFNDILSPAHMEIENVFHSKKVIQQSIVEMLKYKNESIPIDKLHELYCSDGEDDFYLDIYQFYSLVIHPLIKSKEIKVCNLNQCTKEKPLLMTEFVLMYNEK